MKYFLITVITIVTLAIGVGFFVVGSPAKERVRKSDDVRIQHLGAIQSELIGFWQAKQKLPDTTSELNDALRGFSVPKDPVTGAEYEYEKKDGTSFQLCATFALSSSSTDALTSGRYKAVPYPVYGPNGPFVGGDRNWNHDAGRACFDRTIDPDFFKPQPTVNKD